MRTIDIHTHGIDGYDTRTVNPEDILKIAEIQGSFGVTEIIPTIYSAPIHVMRESMAAVGKATGKQGERIKGQGLRVKYEESRRKGQGSANSEFSILNSKFAFISGIHLEGPFLNPAYCGALDPSSFLKPDKNRLDELLDGFEDMVKIVTIAPELEGSLNLIKQARNMGINVSMGHSDATYAEAETGYHAGARGITHIFNAMRGIHHREPGIAGFGLLNQDIFIEVIADPFHLHPETIKMIFAVKSPDRIIIISDSTKDTHGFPLIAHNKFNVQRSMFNVEKLDTHTVQPRWRMDKTVLSSSAGILRGGSVTIRKSAHQLIDMGYNEKIILKCITENPASYLRING